MLRHKTGAIKERKRRCHHQKKNRGTRRKNEDRGAQTAYNSGYMAPLRFTQIFAPLRSAKTSYSRGTLAEKNLPLKKSLKSSNPKGSLLRAGGRGVWGEFRPPYKFWAKSVRIFSKAHRQLENGIFPSPPASQVLSSALLKQVTRFWILAW